MATNFYNPRKKLGPGGVKTVSDKNTPERLSSVSIPCSGIVLHPLSTNTKPVHLKSDIDITNDYPDWDKFQGAILDCQDPHEVFCKVEVDGEGVKWQVIY